MTGFRADLEKGNQKGQVRVKVILRAEIENYQKGGGEEKGGRQRLPDLREISKKKTRRVNIVPVGESGRIQR